MMTRAELSAKIEFIGGQVNDLRGNLLDAQKPFTAGIVRGAEESLLVVKTMLDDPNVQEKEL